jgi:hypothetical protein
MKAEAVSNDNCVDEARNKVLRKNHEIILAIMDYMTALKATGHVKPTPPFPKDEIARLVLGTQLLNVIIAVANGSLTQGLHPLPHQ